MPLRLYHRLLIHDARGRLRRDTGLRPAHCFVRQFLEMMKARFDGDIAVTATDTSGAESTIIDDDDSYWFSRTDAPQGDDAYGIQVGTNAGVTAEANANYTIDTLINHSGVGAAGCLNYQAVTFVPPVVDGANVDFDVSRPFLNESGNTITVKEITLVCKNVVDTKYHLLMRDVVPDEAVDDAETLTVVYTLRTTV